MKLFHSQILISEIHIIIIIISPFNVNLISMPTPIQCLLKYTDWGEIKELGDVSIQQSVGNTFLGSWSEFNARGK